MNLLDVTLFVDEHLDWHFADPLIRLHIQHVSVPSLNTLQDLLVGQVEENTLSRGHVDGNLEDVGFSWFLEHMTCRHALTYALVVCLFSVRIFVFSVIMDISV